MKRNILPSLNFVCTIYFLYICSHYRFAIDEPLPSSLDVRARSTIHRKHNRPPAVPPRSHRYEMGNCLKRSTADDISLLRGSESGGGRESTDQLEPAPLYSVREHTLTGHILIQPYGGGSCRIFK